MAATAIISGYINLENIDKSKIKDGKFLQIDLSILDKSQFGNNVAISHNQTKEEREAKAKRVNLGWAGVRWINKDTKIEVAEKADVTSKDQNPSRDNDDLPF
mgnify:CR=1 FL=1|jgi:hypothetical protein|tara:strand:+ start:3639 stop:3944 length:306 start_codon:yes stop_codon:yes gene_type:complete